MRKQVCARTHMTRAVVRERERKREREREREGELRTFAHPSLECFHRKQQRP